MKEGPLAAEDHYSFRFVDKWRISHSWLSGPTDIWPCKYPNNSFRRIGGYGDLEAEINSPFVEKEGVLYLASEHKGNWTLSNRREWIYGTNPEGKFEGYSAFCGHFFEDAFDGIVLNIVKPDPAKGTDEWVQGAKSVMVNGQVWLKKTEPIKDWDGHSKTGRPHRNLGTQNSGYKILVEASSFIKHWRHQ